MAGSLGNDILLIPVLFFFFFFSPCLVFAHVYFLFFFVICISRLANICILCMHSCTLWSLLAEFSFLLHICSWEQVKLFSSLVHHCTFHFTSFFYFFPPRLFYCIPFRLSCRIGEDFYILAFIILISKTKPINSFNQTLI